MNKFSRSNSVILFRERELGCRAVERGFCSQDLLSDLIICLRMLSALKNIILYNLPGEIMMQEYHTYISTSGYVCLQHLSESSSSCLQGTMRFHGRQYRNLPPNCEAGISTSRSNVFGRCEVRHQISPVPRDMAAARAHVYYPPDLNHQGKVLINSVIRGRISWHHLL